MLAGQINRLSTLFLMISMIGLTSAGKLDSHQAARIHVWDCQHPLATAVYDGQTFCRPNGGSIEHQQVHQAVLAQVVERHRAEGFKCEATRTTRSHICGAFSYEKALPSMTSTVQLQMTESACRETFYNGVFRDPETGHKQRDLKGEGVFHFSANIQGVEYISDGDTSCQGVSAVVNGQVIDRLIQTAEYKLVVTKERFELTKQTVTAMSTGELLSCPPMDRGCTGALHTYSWTIPTSMDCPLQVIRKATLAQAAGSALLVDLPAEIVLELAGTSPRQYGACTGDWYATTEPRIAVMLNASAAPSLPQVQPEEVDPFLALALGRMYVQYRLSALGTANDQVTEVDDCRRRLSALENNHVVPLAPGKFARWSGDALEVFECQRVTTTLRTGADECHRDIPVHGHQPFADVHTRILQGASPVVPCA